MEQTVAFYDSNTSLWDHTVENDSSIDGLADKIVDKLRLAQPRFERIASAITERPQSPVRLDSPVKG
jgi:hypothetical protein